ncbi:hypothetical protein F652_657 [Enterobacteriaceae bacterium bta3-1]|nr:hypothetical protein F652_657 [Enterobacteriaceae bacterium bta3-1]
MWPNILSLFIHEPYPLDNSNRIVVGYARGSESLIGISSSNALAYPLKYSAYLGDKKTS